MSLVTMALTMWTNSEGVPERFFWEGRRYRVTDRPTRLPVDFGLVTHPPVVPDGWRFQGTDEAGDCRVFDVMYSDQRQEWLILRSYV